MVMINGNCFGHSSKHKFEKDIMESRVELLWCVALVGRNSIETRKRVYRIIEDFVFDYDHIRILYKNQDSP